MLLLYTPVRLEMKRIAAANENDKESMVYIRRDSSVPVIFS